METARRAVLFVDLADSTKIDGSLGDTAALALISALFSHFDKIVAKYSGSIVKTLGDCVLCVFESPDDGFRAACEMQSTGSSLAQGAQHRLQIRIGFACGPVILVEGDVFGDTMNVCVRLATLANPEQILASGEAVAALSPGLRPRCRELFPTRVKGKAEQVQVSDVIWRYDPAVTLSTLSIADLAKSTTMSLKLIYQGNIFVVDRARPLVQIGRDDSNDIVTVSLFASRIHTRVHWREGRFVLSDASTNGTYLLIDEQPSEVHLRRAEAMLVGRGWIGLGRSAAKHGDHSVRFMLQPAQPG